MECPYPRIPGITRNMFGLHLSDNRITSEKHAGVFTCKVTYKILHTYVPVSKTLTVSYVDTTNAPTIVTPTTKHTITRLPRTAKSTRTQTGNTNTPIKTISMRRYMFSTTYRIVAKYSQIETAWLKTYIHQILEQSINHKSQNLARPWQRRRNPCSRAFRRNPCISGLAIP